MIQIDKSVSLDAEKGKIMYSTQEVDAIKEQNKALKLELYSKVEEMNTLENKVNSLDVEFQ